MAAAANTKGKGRGTRKNTQATKKTTAPTIKKTAPTKKSKAGKNKTTALTADADGSFNGKTRMINEFLEYRSADGWIPAVYHNDIRAHLIAEGPQGDYDIPRSRGKEDTNVTSFHPAYETNGPDRDNRHSVLFRYRKDAYPVPSYKPETWMWRDHIVLDLDDNPVRKWLELPEVLSTEYDGYDMETVRRLNLRITWPDIRARMPFTVIEGTNQKKSPLTNTLSMRAGRWRTGACCIAWEDREGSDKIKDYLDNLLPKACHDANSTENFRDLTTYEADEAKERNKGLFANRAGARALDEETRLEREEVKQKRKKKHLAEHTSLIGSAPLPALKDPAPRRQGTKRKRAETTEDGEEDTRAAKRSAWPANIDPIFMGPEYSIDASVSVKGSTTAIPNESNDFSGRGQESGQPQKSEAEEMDFDQFINSLDQQQQPAVEVQDTNFDADFGPTTETGFGQWGKWVEDPEAGNSDVEEIQSEDSQPRDGTLEDTDNDEEATGDEEMTDADARTDAEAQITDGDDAENQGFGLGSSHGSPASARKGSSGEAKQKPRSTGQPALLLSRFKPKTAQQQGSRPNQPSAQDDDFCLRFPDGPTEQFAVYCALEPTRQDCRQRLLLKDLDIRTEPWKPYYAQWLDIQATFELIWSSADAREAPNLTCLDGWEGSFKRLLPNLGGMNWR